MREPVELTIQVVTAPEMTSQVEAAGAICGAFLDSDEYRQARAKITIAIRI